MGAWAGGVFEFRGGAAVLDHSLAMESRERFARDVVHTFATQARLVCDISDSNCWAQSGRTHGRRFAIFKQAVIYFISRKYETKMTASVLIFHLIFQCLSPFNCCLSVVL